MNDVDLVCDRCQEPVDNDSYVVLLASEMRRYQEERGEGFSLAMPCHWYVLHQQCELDPDDVHYWLDASGLTSYANALGWTAHLMEKQWVAEETDWTALIRMLAHRGTNRGRLA